MRFLDEILLYLSEIKTRICLLLCERIIRGALETKVRHVSAAVIHLKVEFHTSIMQK